MLISNYLGRMISFYINSQMSAWHETMYAKYESIISEYFRDICQKFLILLITHYKDVNQNEISFTHINFKNSVSYIHTIY